MRVLGVWGDGSVVAADGTQVDTFIDNLLAETSIRYGGTGGIGYYYISDTYIALFSKFIPVGVWEGWPGNRVTGASRPIQEATVANTQQAADDRQYVDPADLMGAAGPGCTERTAGPRGVSAPS